MDSSNSQSVHADESNRAKMSVKACEHVTKVSRHDGTTWCNGCHERSQNGFVVEFDYNTMQYEVVKTYKIIFREAGTSGKCKDCGSDKLSMLIEATSHKEAIKRARKQIVIQAVD